MYEIYIAIFSASITAGFIIGHMLGQRESKIQYERGYLDAIWNIYVAAIKSSLERYTAKNNDGGTGRSK